MGKMSIIVPSSPRAAEIWFRKLTKCWVHTKWSKQTCGPIDSDISGYWGDGFVCCLWDAWIQQLNVFTTAQAHLAWSWSPIYLHIYIIYGHIQLPVILFQYGKAEKKVVLEITELFKISPIQHTFDNFTDQQFMLSVPGCVSKYSWPKPPKTSGPENKPVFPPQVRGTSCCYAYPGLLKLQPSEVEGVPKKNRFVTRNHIVEEACSNHTCWCKNSCTTWDV